MTLQQPLSCIVFWYALTYNALEDFTRLDKKLEHILPNVTPKTSKKKVKKQMHENDINQNQRYRQLAECISLNVEANQRKH